MVLRLRPAHLRASAKKPPERIGAVLLVKRSCGFALFLLIELSPGEIQPNPGSDITAVVISFAYPGVVVDFQLAVFLMLFPSKVDDLKPSFFVIDAAVWTEAVIGKCLGCFTAFRAIHVVFSFPSSGRFLLRNLRKRQHRRSMPAAVPIFVLQR